MPKTELANDLHYQLSGGTWFRFGSRNPIRRRKNLYTAQTPTTQVQSV